MLPVFLLVASLASVEGLSKDRCLGYDVLCTTADYQVRRYNDSVWVGIHGSYVHKIATDSAPLYRYLTGRNLEEMWIPYTGQVLVSLTGFRVLAIYILLPEELRDNPPTATDTRLFITPFPMMDVIARMILLYAMTDASDFNRTLTEQNVPVNNSNFFVYSCFGRHRVRPAERAVNHVSGFTSLHTTEASSDSDAKKTISGQRLGIGD
ncbi:uncharacterized protein [Hemitrygon akajei]|uniref:uncharacterized protein n=1 Tax=Hemitrygon akajei TaxID=2704970 RepID=UPI003BF9E762